MQTGQRIYKDCDQCNATGTMHFRVNYDHPLAGPSTSGVGDIPCEYCDGLGTKPWGWLRDEKETTMPGEEA